MPNKPTLKVIPPPKDTPHHEVYINNRLWTNRVYFNEADKLIHIDDFPPLKIQKLKGLRATDFPNKFKLQWRIDKPIHRIFDMFSITRKGSRISVEVYGSYTEWKNNLTDTLWNPIFFVREMAHVARQLGHKSSCETNLGSEYISVTLIVQYKTEGTITELFDKTMDLSLQIMEQANRSLLQKASKQLAKQ